MTINYTFELWHLWIVCGIVYFLAAVIIFRWNYEDALENSKPNTGDRDGRIALLMCTSVFWPVIAALFIVISPFWILFKIVTIGIKDPHKKKEK